MRDNKNFRVGEEIVWLCPMYESNLRFHAEVVKLFKNGKVRIKYRNMYGVGDLCYANKDPECLERQ